MAAPVVLRDAATTTPDPCTLFTLADVLALSGGSGTLTSGSAPTGGVRNCEATVHYPTKVLPPGGSSSIVTLLVDLVVRPQSQDDFDAEKPANPVGSNLGNGAYYDSFQKQVVWRKAGVRYSLNFVTGGIAVDQTKITTVLSTLATKIMTKI